jgi:hypothetical protein
VCVGSHFARNKVPGLDALLVGCGLDLLLLTRLLGFERGHPQRCLGDQRDADVNAAVERARREAERFDKKTVLSITTDARSTTRNVMLGTLPAHDWH